MIMSGGATQLISKWKWARFWGYGCYQKAKRYTGGAGCEEAMTLEDDRPPTLYHQIPIQHIHLLERIRDDRPGCQEGPLCYRLGPRRVDRTRTMGIIVLAGTQEAASASSGDVREPQAPDASSFWLDDGTGVIEVLVRNELQATVKVGDLVDVLGEISQDEYPGESCHQQASRRKILAEKVLLADDPNMESLRMLESVALYKRCYLTKEAPSQTAPPVMDGDIVSRVLAMVGRAVEGVREEVIEAAVGVQRSHVQAILERLQVEGSIYRAQDGAYYPL